MNIPKVFGLKGMGIALLVGCTVGSCSTWKLRDMMADHAKVKAAEARTVAVQHARTTEGATAKVAAEVGVKVEAAQTHTRAITRKIKEEVPRYVTPAADRACIVPVGFVQLHDASATGTAPTPLAAGQSADAPSGVELSAVSATVAENYGYTHELETQVRGWQAFWAGVAEKMDGGK